MKIKEERITIAGTVSIGATLTFTDKSRISPAVVLIMGTGKTDRDGNQKGFHTDLYKHLTELFAERGFVCFRYDKRGTYETEGNYNTTGLYDLSEDAVAVIRYAKSLPFVDEKRIIVCGHSEGTMIATLLSTQESAAGLILLGGAMMNAKWLREHDIYTSKSFEDMVNGFDKPVLAITGTADQQADYRCLEAFSKMKHVQTYTPQNVNHILRLVDDDNSMLTVQKQYKRLAKQPIHGGTAQTIESWLHQFG